MTTKLNKQAAKMCRNAAKFLYDNPLANTFGDTRGCCNALHEVWHYKQNYGQCHSYFLACEVFDRLYRRRSRSGYFWPRTMKYHEQRVLALLFTAEVLDHA